MASGCCWSNGSGGLWLLVKWFRWPLDVVGQMLQVACGCFSSKSPGGLWMLWPLAVVGQMVQVASGCCWSIGPGGQRSPQGCQSQFTRGGRTAATETVKIENP